MMYAWNDGAYLMHHGVKGQKWGTRKYQNDDGSYTSLGQQQNGGHGRYAKNDSNNDRKSKSKKQTYTMTDAERKRYYRLVGQKDDVSLLEKKSLFGKATGNYEIRSGNRKVGDAIVDDEGDTLHLDWLGVKESERRKGYGQKALDIVIKDAIQQGKRYVTLDAAGLDPAAIHIYEKQGFKAVKQIDEDIWNGLTVMRKDLGGE